MSLQAWNQEKRERSYLFIDGGYLRAKFSGFFSDVFRNDAVRLDYYKVAGAFPCSKYFYYDCIDEQRPGEDPTAFAARNQAQLQEFEAIRAFPGYHVIEGTLSARRQKEVDVALAVDMLTHAFNRNMGWAHLIAGDLDFRPLVQSLVRLGIYVTLWSRRTSTAKRLRWAADDACEISAEHLYSWCTSETSTQCSMPEVFSGMRSADGCTIRKRGAYHGGSVTIYSRPGNLCCLQAVGTSDRFGFNHRDPEVLERYFKAEYGDVSWQSQ